MGATGASKLSMEKLEAKVVCLKCYKAIRREEWDNQFRNFESGGCLDGLLIVKKSEHSEKAFGLLVIAIFFQLGSPWIR